MEEFIVGTDKKKDGNELRLIDEPRKLNNGDKNKMPIYQIVDTKLIGYFPENSDWLKGAIDYSDSDEIILLAINPDRTILSYLEDSLEERGDSLFTNRLSKDLNLSYGDGFSEYGGMEFYLAYWVKLDEVPTTIYSVLECYLPAIFNGDIEQLDNWEVEQLDNWEPDLSKGSIVGESYFGMCDISATRGDVVDILVID